MVLVGHSKRLAEPLHWGRRERIAVAAVVICLVAAAIAGGLYAALSGGSSAPAAGCVNATLASYTGGSVVRICGANARDLCRTGGRGADLASLKAECRRAGYSFRSPRASR